VINLPAKFGKFRSLAQKSNYLGTWLSTGSKLYLNPETTNRTSEKTGDKHNSFSY